MLAAAANSGVRAEDEYSSAEARSLDPSDPPATSTSPFRSIVAECPTRAAERLGPLDTVPAAGATISLEFRIWLRSDPPTMMNSSEIVDPAARSEEQTSERESRRDVVCRLPLAKNDQNSPDQDA